MVDFAKLRRESYERATPEVRARIDAANAAREAEAARSRPMTAVFVHTAWKGHWRKGETIETGRETRPIRVRIDERPSTYADEPRVLVFDGGPTGYEAYRLEAEFIAEVTRKDRGNEWSICGGTTGVWPACSVSRLDLLAFLREMAPDLVS